jgi:hypothetical protein
MNIILEPLIERWQAPNGHRFGSARRCETMGPSILPSQ